MLVLQGKIFGKPHNLERAREQLRSLSGKTHELLTAVHLQWTDPEGVHYENSHLNTCHLRMRTLKDWEIEEMLQADRPFDCAGSYKIESRGISLFEEIDCEDWTAIEGLPLLWLHQSLRQWNLIQGAPS